MLLKHDKVLEKVNVLMGKSFNLIPVELLRQKIFLFAKLRNTTQWSTSFEMMQRYCYVRHHLPVIDRLEVKELLLSDEEISDFNALLKLLTNLISVTVEPQSDCKIFVECWVLFDGVLKKCV